MTKEAENISRIRDILFGNNLTEFEKRIEKNYVIKDIYFEDNGKNFHYFESVQTASFAGNDFDKINYRW